MNNPTVRKKRMSGSKVLNDFDLNHFFPYRLRVLDRAVSEAISSVYTSRFGLSVSQWRTLAVLGDGGVMSASEIVQKSSMDKVVVSRAIKGLQNRDFLKRKTDINDRRRVVLKLTAKGKRMFDNLVPLVKQLEEECLRGLTRAERATLDSLMERIRANTDVVLQ
ncbi:MAG: MarR family winged helix-turn-helix transcriptional regulator [Rhizobiaceae bacterium]|nr:MarR family winged helix-turn-helix transcriptional regulator [Rhizobiaceae bacterium]